MKNKSWPNTLQKINFSVMVLLSFLVMSTLFFAYEESWRFLPVFKYHLSAPDKLVDIFVHAYLFAFNLGFFLLLSVLIFSWMIFLSTKRNISFHMMYSLVIIRSILILIQNNVPPENYISEKGNSAVFIVHFSYIAFFLTLFILNLIYDTKKRPRSPEPFDIVKD